MKDTTKLFHSYTLLKYNNIVLKRKHPVLHDVRELSRRSQKTPHPAALATLKRPIRRRARF